MFILPAGFVFILVYLLDKVDLVVTLKHKVVSIMLFLCGNFKSLLMFIYTVFIHEVDAFV